MAASKFSVQSFDLKHYAKTEAYARAVQALFDSATRDIMRMKQVGTFDPNKPFSWNDYPQAKAEMEKITLQLATRVVGVIERGSREEWLSSCKKNDAWLDSIMDTSKLSKEHLRQFQDRRLDALQAFQERKVGGLDLSQRVWKYVAQYKENLEDGIDLGLGKGTSADVLSREVRQYLRDPDMYFRRFRVKVGTDESGQTIYGRKWKRMVKTADGVRWIDEAPSDYHPGQGVYRSSYKNAMRLTRSEINMAYRESDWQRWQQLDFVVGFEIHRSNHEPQFKCKLCDRLTGRYPKNFRFIGWHPQCRCYVTPIIADRETFNSNELSDLKAALRGGTAQHQQAKNAVVKMPDNFTQWAEETAAKVAAGEMSIKSTPYFIRDNFTAGDIMQGVKPEVEQYNPLLSISEAQSIVEMARKRHAARTQQEIDDIRQRAAERQKAIRDAETTQKRASNAINIASQFKDIDSAELQDVLDVVNSKSFYRPSEIAELKQATLNIIAQIKAQQTAEKALADLIPDVHDWHKQFTLAELQGAYNGIKKVFDKIDSWAYDAQVKQLAKEIQYVEDPNYLKPHTKYPTWKVSQTAFMKKLDAVNYKIAVADIENQLKSIETWLAGHAKATKTAALWQEAQNAIANGEDIAVVKMKADMAFAEYKKRIQEHARRDAKKGAITFTEKSQKEIDALLHEFKNSTVDGVDSALRPWSESIWATLSDEERTVLTKYTQTYCYLNERLRGLTYSGGTPLSEYENDMPLLTQALNKFKTKKDMVVRRGTDSYYIPELKKDLSMIQVGDEFTDGAFLSTAAHREKGFFKSYELIIVVPKGARGAFAEPFSHFTDSCKYNYSSNLWDGKAKEDIGHEFEWIGQRGCRFKVLKVDGKRIFLQMIGQLK